MTREADRWTLHFEITPANRRRVESLTALSNGRFGTRGLITSPHEVATKSTVASGIFNDEDVPSLLAGPAWTVVDVGTIVAEHATLDLRRGVLESTIHHKLGASSSGAHGATTTTRVTQFVSRVRDSIHVLVADCLPGVEIPAAPLLLRPDQPESPDRQPTTLSGPRRSSATVTGRTGCITAAAAEWTEGNRTVRIASFTAGPPSEFQALRQEAADELDRAVSDGFVTLLEEHASAWQARWDRAAIDITGRPDLELATRFAQFHLLAASDDSDDCGIAARGLTGLAYRGHVFWDGDVFVVPALSAMAPELARTALLYRFNRLGAAMARAASEGRAGARFPGSRRPPGSRRRHPGGGISRDGGSQSGPASSRSTSWPTLPGRCTTTPPGREISSSSAM